MGRNDDLLGAIGGLYQAAQDAAAWPAALEGICDLVRADRGGLLFVNDRQTDRPLVGVTVGLDPRSWDDYQEYYHHFDIWRQAGVRLPKGSVTTGPELVSRDSFMASPWLNEFLGRYDIFRVLTSLPDGPEQQFLSFFRSESLEDFDLEEKQLLQTLVPHVGAALKMQFRLRALQSRKVALDTALDHIPVGVVLVDGGRRIIEMNRAARESVDANDGLKVRDRHLLADQHSQTVTLDELLARAIALTEGRDIRPAGSMALARPSNRRPYSIQVAPVPARCASRVQLFDYLQPAAIVFISDPTKEVELPEDGLKRCYGLTPAESRLAARLVNGQDLGEAAAGLEIAVGTARNQLKSVLHKTNTRRQAELMKLLLSDIVLATHSQAVNAGSA